MSHSQFLITIQKLADKISLMPPIRILHARKLVYGVIFLGLLYIFILYERNNSQIDDRDRRSRLEKIDELVKSNAGSESCKLPDLPVDSPEIMRFIKNEPLVNCSAAAPDWVIVEESICKINDFAKRLHGIITCDFTDLIRIDDYHLKDGQTTTIKDSYYTLQNSDVVRVVCKSHTGKRWQTVLTGIRQDASVMERTGWSKLPEKAMKLNVLMFGFDSLSRNSFTRKLPKSYKYFVDVLGGQVLEGYNIVGDGTPQALIPILTGKTELELPDTRKRISGSANVDVYPFIWKEFQKHGYVTAFLEDTPYVGTFTYRLNGFDKPPTDHYMRPYYLASAPLWSHSPHLCHGAIPRHKIMMDYVKDFFSIYKEKPKFMFGFHGELSHDSYNLIGVADNDMLNFLKDLKSSGALNNTLLILMADHGHRFAEIRNTVQGKLEERLPFFSFAFPKAFRHTHKQAYENFILNKQKLTTPFDIYSTLKDVLGPKNLGPADLKERSLSLFSQIPSKRGCAEAYIEPHWCACLDWHSISTDLPVVQQLAKTLADTINTYTATNRQLCEPLSIKEIEWAMQLTPNNNLLKFKKNADIDGFVGDFSAEMKVDRRLYQVKVKFQPGDSIFEASLTHYLKEDKFTLEMSDISRINMYGRQARCIEKDLPHLRKYCYCKDDL